VALVAGEVFAARGVRLVGALLAVGDGVVAEDFLGVGADLGADPRAHIFSNLLPVLVEEAYSRQEALVFLGGPAALRLALFLGGGGLFGLGGRFQRIRKQLFIGSACRKPEGCARAVLLAQMRTRLLRILALNFTV